MIRFWRFPFRFRNTVSTYFSHAINISDITLLPNCLCPTRTLLLPDILGGGGGLKPILRTYTVCQQALQATPPPGELVASGWARTLEEEEDIQRGTAREEEAAAGPTTPRTSSTEEALAKSPILGTGRWLLDNLLCSLRRPYSGVIPCLGCSTALSCFILLVSCVTDICPSCSRLYRPPIFPLRIAHKKLSIIRHFH
jgi:hypothetical protein